MNSSGSPTSITYIFFSFWRHRQLILQMTKREVIGRYRGSMMGLLWSFFNPIFMLTVYTFVFSVIFNARWGEPVGGKMEFALILFAGMVVHSLFAECVNRAPGLILNNVNYVKKVVFPLEILPWVALGSSLFHALISIAVLLLAYTIIHHSLNWTVVFLPVLLLPFVLVILGLSWFLAATGVYLRDIGQITGFLTTTLMFLSPIFYPTSALPVAYRGLLNLNPLTFIIEQTRGLTLAATPPDWVGLGVYSFFGVISAWAGLFWFQKTRKGFADVL